MYQMVKLGDVYTIERGGSPRPIEKYITNQSDGINWIKIGDTSDSMYITSTAQKIIPEGMKKSRYVRPGDFLLSNSMSFGRPYILKIDGCIHDGWLVLRDEADVFDKQFLYYFLSAPSTYETFKTMAVGGVVNNLNSDMVRKLLVPLCSKDEQRKITQRLLHIDSVITARREQLAKLDELVKSRFIELIGGADYPKVLFENVCVFLRNGASIKQTKGAGGYPITRIETLSNDVFNIDRLGYADITDLEKYQSYVLHNRDILISHINSVAYLGRAVQYRGQLDTPIIHGMNLLCARIADSYNPTYIEWFFKTPMAKEYISTITKKAVNQASITTSDLKKMQVPNPPKNLQDQFAAFVEQTDKSKLAVQKSIAELEELKKSLMQKYFG
jgi:type I restriction enzyme S subunit